MRKITFLLVSTMLAGFGMPAQAAPEMSDTLSLLLTGHLESNEEVEAAWAALSGGDRQELRRIARKDRDADPKVRLKAIRHLGSRLAGPDTEKDLLFIAKGTANIEVWHAAVYSMILSCGDETRKYLKSTLEGDAPPPKSLFSLNTLAECGTPDDLPAIEPLEQHPNQGVRGRAMDAEERIKKRFPAP